MESLDILKIVTAVLALATAIIGHEIMHGWVAYKYGDGDHPYMGEFKRCALVSVSVGHNPTSNTHTTFSDGMPVVTSMNLIFQEVDIVLREDHENSKSLQGF